MLELSLSDKHEESAGERTDKSKGSSCRIL